MDLISFVRESNRIEGILREPLPREIKAHERILGLGSLEVGDFEVFVADVQPGAILRRVYSLDVRVGNHIAPPGAPEIEYSLRGILVSAQALGSGCDPFTVHQRYEHLHPFTDGNGRSGRALWLWMMAQCGQIDQALALGFLHTWYYQSLSGWREK